MLILFEGMCGISDVGVGENWGLTLRTLCAKLAHAKITRPEGLYRDISTRLRGLYKVI